MRTESNETIPTDMELLNAYARSGVGVESEDLCNKRLLNAFDWLDQVKLKAVAAGLKKPPTTTRTALTTRRGRTSSQIGCVSVLSESAMGLPARGSVVGTVPQYDFEEGIGVPW